MAFLYNNWKLKERRKMLRNNVPEPELILWYYLRGKNLKGYKFRRQYSVGAYVVDFYCPAIRLAIELDGDSHYYRSAKVYDQIRENVLKNVGINVLRFTNIDVRDNIESVVGEILKYLP